MMTCALLLALAVAAAAFGDTEAATRSRSPRFWRPQLPPAIAATCQAAHDADKRASVTFCTDRFALLGGTVQADARSLAKTAARMGAGRADTAQTMIDRTLDQRGGVDDPRARRALERCGRLYGSARAAFEAAHKAIAEGRYADVTRSLEGVPELGRQCDSENAAAGSGDLAPIWIFSGANEQFAYLTVAITRMIK